MYLNSHDKLLPKHFVLTYFKKRSEDKTRYFYTGNVNSPVGLQPEIFKFTSWKLAEDVKCKVNRDTKIGFRIYLLSK